MNNVNNDHYVCDILSEKTNNVLISKNFKRGCHVNSSWEHYYKERKKERYQIDFWTLE